MYIIQRQFAEQSFRYCQMSAIYGLQYSLPDIIIILSSFNFYYQAKAIRWSLSIEDRPWDNFIFKMFSARRQWHVTCEWWTPNGTHSCLCEHFNGSNLVICWLLTFCPVSVGWVMEEKQVSQSYQTFSAKLCQQRPLWHSQVRRWEIDRQ